MIKSARVFAFPSTREGFGIVVLEANACGTPVVVVDHKDNGSRALIKKGINGELVKLDPKEFSQAIQLLLTSKRSRNFEDQVTKYSWDTMLKQYMEVYKNEKN
jgi:glycosyltransferase involved in cell wall biosynthesis